MTITYSSPGVYIRPAPSGARPIEGVGTAVAAFVGFTEKAPTEPGQDGYDPGDPQATKPRHVSSWAMYQRLYGGFAAGTMLPYSVHGFFANGGGSAYIVRVPGGEREGAPPATSVPSAAQPDVDVLRVTARDLTGRVQLEVRAAPTADPSAGQGDSDTGDSGQGDSGQGDSGQGSGGDGGGQGRARGGSGAGRQGSDQPQGGARLTLVVRSGDTEEIHEDLTVGPGARNVATAVTAASALVTVDQLSPGGSPEDLVPRPGRYELSGGAPRAIGSGEFEGAESERTGIHGLAIADEVTMVAVPDLVTAARRDDGGVDLDMWQTVQTALIGHCSGTRSRMAILDVPPDRTSAQQVKEWREQVGYDSEFAAMYHPWLVVPDRHTPKSKGGRLLVPPCGHVAGIWARTDATRGVHKAPANEVVRDVLDVATPITKGEQDLLNPIGVNCIRPFGTRGIRVWGARTVSFDTDWQYVNVRRLFTYVEQSIERGIQWVVFEPNGIDLWQRVKRSLTSFLLPLWESGALAGATPDQGFFVKCDAENNPEDQVKKGLLTIDVGLAATRPAEFVVVTISQYTATGS